MNAKSEHRERMLANIAKAEAEVKALKERLDDYDKSRDKSDLVSWVNHFAGRMLHEIAEGKFLHEYGFLRPHRERIMNLSRFFFAAQNATTANGQDTAINAGIELCLHVALLVKELNKSQPIPRRAQPPDVVQSFMSDMNRLMTTPEPITTQLKHEVAPNDSLGQFAHADLAEVNCPSCNVPIMYVKAQFGPSHPMSCPQCKHEGWYVDERGNQLPYG